MIIPVAPHGLEAFPLEYHFRIQQKFSDKTKINKVVIIFDIEVFLFLFLFQDEDL